MRYRSPPYEIDLKITVDEVSVGKIGKLLDEEMGWSGRGRCSPAARNVVEIVLGIVEKKQAIEAKIAAKSS